MTTNTASMKTKVITYSTPSGDRCNLTPRQVKALEAAGRWPKDSKGNEFCQVSHGLHFGYPTWESNLASDILA